MLTKRYYPHCCRDARIDTSFRAFLLRENHLKIVHHTVKRLFFSILPVVLTEIILGYAQEENWILLDRLSRFLSFVPWCSSQVFSLSLVDNHLPLARVVPELSITISLHPAERSVASLTQILALLSEKPTMDIMFETMGNVISDHTMTFRTKQEVPFNGTALGNWRHGYKLYKFGFCFRFLLSQ